MLRRLIAFFVGVLIAVLCFSAFERINSKLFPVPNNIDVHDIAAMRPYYSNLPCVALLVLLSGWIFGSFICGIAIALITQSSNKKPSYIAGLFLTTAGIVSLFINPYPIWFVIIGVLVFIPFTLLGHLIIPQKT